MKSVQSIDEKQAIEIAKKVAEENSWAWVEPVHAVWHSAWNGNGGKWEIFSNALLRGTRMRVIIEDPSGEILEKGYISR